MKTRKLNVRERKFVKAKVQGKSNLQAAAEAGYSVKNKEAAAVYASNVNTRPHIQEAINQALESQGATPEWAVAQMMKVAAQDEEMGAKRLAAMNILELHGWNKADRPTLELNIKNASFFNQGRKYVDGDQT